MKRLRTIVECILVVLVGSLLITLINRIPSEPKVENIIYMIGDGMGISHISSAQISHDYEPLNMERAEYVGLCKTYSANNLITDSAAAGTALSTGYKTNNGMVCMTPDKQPHPSIREKAEKSGMATGIVATYAVTHATPASFIAQIDNRNKQDEIAKFYLSNEVDVIMGGGSKRFEKRADSLDLLTPLREKGYTIARNLGELEGVSEGKVALLAAENAMPSMLEGRGDFLPEATAKALELLTANAKAKKSGFFLMVEGSQIDGKGHGNDFEGMLAELEDFDRAVKVAFDYADSHPGTLVVVASDHETGGLTIVNSSRSFDPNDRKIDYAWSTNGHSGAMTPVFAYGAGAENFTGVLENTDLPRIMCRLLGLDKE